MPTSEEAAAAAAAEAISNEAEETQSGSETDETTDEVVFPSFEVDIPAELRAELEEEELDLSATDDDLESLAEQYPEAEESVLKALAKERKRADYLERLRVQEAKKNWEEEARKFFPLAEPFLDEINATSRRGFLRTAKSVHDKMLPLVEEKVLKPARERIEAEKVEEVEKAKDEVKAGWGAPVPKDREEEGPNPAEVVRQGRRPRELSDVIRGMIFNKES